MKTTKKLMLVAGIMLAAMCLFSSLSQASAAPQSPPAMRTVTSQADNAYKWPSVSSTQDSGLYTEWWYFEVNDGSTMNMTFFYEIDNPEGVTGEDVIPAAANVGMEGFIGDMMVADPYLANYDEWSASTSKLDVNIGGNIIKGIDTNIVHVQGVDTVIGGSWNLWFIRDNVPGLYSDAVPTGYYPTDFMGWCSYMPKARVFGTISLAGETFTICNALGYSDHNWGSPMTLAYAPWAKFYQGNLMMNGGGIMSATNPDQASNGFWNVYYNNAWIYFKVPKVAYTWAVDENGVAFISDFHLTATSQNNKYKVDIIMAYTGAQQFSYILDFGVYSLFFLKSWGFHVTGTFKQVGGATVNINTFTVIEENFFIPNA